MGGGFFSNHPIVPIRTSAAFAADSYLGTVGRSAKSYVGLQLILHSDCPIELLSSPLNYFPGSYRPRLSDRRRTFEESCLPSLSTERIRFERIARPRKRQRLANTNYAANVSFPISYARPSVLSDTEKYRHRMRRIVGQRDHGPTKVAAGRSGAMPFRDYPDITSATPQSPDHPRRDESQPLPRK